MPITQSKASGYPFPPLLIIFPLVFYTAAFTSFIAYQIYSKVFWFHLAYTANVAGILTTLVALVPAVMAWWSDSDTRSFEKKEEVLNVILNGVAFVLFAVNLWLQKDKWDLNFPPLGASVLITGSGLISAYLAAFFGWDLLQKYFSKTPHIA